MLLTWKNASLLQCAANAYGIMLMLYKTALNTNKKQQKISKKKGKNKEKELQLHLYDFPNTSIYGLNTQRLRPGECFNMTLIDFSGIELQCFGQG